jgi:mono/diheme cytochrome c family protein
MNAKATIFLAIALSIFSLNAEANPDPPTTTGKAIFNSRCATCHNVNKTTTGPALAGVDQRRSIDWIINFVHSSQTMVKKGDKDAVEIFEKFNKIPMPDHPDLTEENIRSIVEYIKSETKLAEEKKTPATTPVKKPNYLLSSLTKDFWPMMGLIGAVLLLIATLLFERKVKRMSREFEGKKQAV